MLYTCFVDFKKAFDSVCRDALLNKIHKIGINGQFLQILKSIYSTTTNSLIYHEFLSPKFISNVGVKQGDLLSAILFNLCINDFSINNNNVNCLKYAADLVLMSTSKDLFFLFMEFILE